MHESVFGFWISVTAILAVHLRVLVSQPFEFLVPVWIELALIVVVD